MTGTSGASLPARFGLESTVALANVYYDFDTRTRFTPYVGIGLGVAFDLHQRRHADELHLHRHHRRRGDAWSAAGALMAGFSVALRERFALDAGYRFLHISEAHTGAIVGSSADAGSTIRLEGLNAHEFRVGLRYDIR